MSWEQDRLYRRGNTAVDLATGIAAGVVWYWAIRNLTRKAWAYFLSSLAALFGAVLWKPEEVEGANGVYSSSTSLTPLQGFLFVAAAVLFVFAICEVYGHGQQVARANLVAQHKAVAAQAPAQSARPVAQRTERALTVVRAPQPPPAASAPPTTPTAPTAPPTAPTTTSQSPATTSSGLVVVTNTHAPVRHVEQSGPLVIYDRRLFDPELGE